MEKNCTKSHLEVNCNTAKRKAKTMLSLLAFQVLNTLLALSHTCLVIILLQCETKSSNSCREPPSRRVSSRYCQQDFQTSLVPLTSLQLRNLCGPIGKMHCWILFGSELLHLLDVGLHVSESLLPRESILAVGAAGFNICTLQWIAEN